jgi:hypothetical protein
MSAALKRGASARAHAFKYIDAVSQTRSSTMSSAAWMMNWCRCEESSFWWTTARLRVRQSSQSVPDSHRARQRGNARLSGRRQLKLVEREVQAADDHEVRHGSASTDSARESRKCRHAVCPTPRNAENRMAVLPATSRANARSGAP